MKRRTILANTAAQNQTTPIPIMNTVPDILTPAQLAQRWQVCPLTLRRWRKGGRLPFCKLGTRVRFRLVDIEQLEKTPLT